MLRLRPYKKCDAKYVVSWIRDEQTFLKWSAGRIGFEFPITEEVMNAHFAEFEDTDSFWQMTAFDETGVVGHMIMRFLDAEKKVLRFGFIIVDASKRGKGYGKGMLELALKYAFEILKVEKVTIGVFDNNESAYRCYQSLGFKICEKKPFEMYDIKGERWKCLELEFEKKVAPVNPGATKEAAELLNYLYHVAGNQIISGQHTQTNPMEEITYIEQLTGKKPKLRGFEMLAYSPNINYEDATEACLTEVYENRDTMETAVKWAKESGGIVTLSFHWFSPLGGRDKSFYAKNTDFDASKILQEGTAERKAFFADMERIGIVLKRFQDEKIPVLWRPFHESDGEWFWWGAKGPKVARELYKLMFDYYTKELHLDNLLWVWNCRLAEGYPGDDYVDVISVDVYLQEYEATDYEEVYRLLVENTGCRKVAALAEVGYLPDIKQLQESRIPWAYFMLWSKEFCIGEQYNTVETMKEMYRSEYVITE